MQDDEEDGQHIIGGSLGHDTVIGISLPIIYRLHKVELKSRTVGNISVIDSSGYNHSNQQQWATRIHPPTAIAGQSVSPLQIMQLHHALFAFEVQVRNRKLREDHRQVQEEQEEEAVLSQAVVD